MVVLTMGGWAQGGARGDLTLVVSAMGARLGVDR